MKIQWKDIHVVTNKSYWYVHQGNCEHMLLVKDIRLLHSSDSQNANAYPKTIFRSKVRRHKCRMCVVYPAKWITFNDKNSGESPCFFCEKCFNDFHYDENGKLIYNDFEVFPYMYD